MKKFIIVFGLICSVALPTEIMAESSLLKAWKQWVLMKKARVESNEVKTVEVPIKYVEPGPTTEKERQKQQDSIVRKNRPFTSRYTRTKYSGSSFVKSTKLRAHVLATKEKGDVYEITDEAIKLFDVGVKFPRTVTTSRFTEAVLLDKARFKLLQNTGIAEDLDKIEILINDEAVSFDEDGGVEVQFHNARVPVGGELDFDVSVRVKDPAVTPHISGNVLLRMESLSARGERSGVSMTSFLYGNLVSKKLVFAPSSVVNVGKDSEVILRTQKNIYGRMLEEGESTIVLIARFSANYDDLYLRGATLRNLLTGSNIDSLIKRVNAINLENGQVLDTASFIGGRVTFDFKPDVFVDRGGDVEIGFEVEVDDSITSSVLDSRFKLELAPEDTVVQSASTGRMLSDSSKKFSVESEEFSIAREAMVVFPSTYQTSYAVGTGSPQSVFRFMIDGGEVRLGRISFDVVPSGLTFAGGNLSPDDVELAVVVDGREYLQNTDVSASGYTINVDFDSPYLKTNAEMVQFALRLALEDLPGDSDADSLSVKILGDSSYENGTLAQLRGGGSNFVWSDMSARQHSETTVDWFSGYKVSGLPSNAVVVKRYK